MDRTRLFNIEDELLELVDPKFAKEQSILPIEKDGGIITIACPDKHAQRVAEHVLAGLHPNLQFRFVYSDAEVIGSAIDCHYLRRDRKRNQEEINERYREISNRIQSVDTGRKRQRHLIFTTSRQFSRKDTALRELIENLLCDAHWQMATDVDIDHFRIDTGNGRLKELMVCRIRVDGDYRVIHEELMELEKYERIPQVLKIYANLDPNNNWDGQSGVIRPTLAYSTRESSVEFRVNFIPSGDNRGESISIRIQEKDNFTFDLDSIGLLPAQLQLFREQIMMLTEGLVVFAGPVNRGKNTSMVCQIKEFQRVFPTKKIVTVEDPPEFNLPYVTQIAISRKHQDEKGLRGFQYYLTHLLRHNPDIIVVGEVREPEPARMAIEAAGIGHLVLTTMHTSRAVESIDRLRNFGIENYKIAGSIKAVIAQRLVKRVCTECDLVPDESRYCVERLQEYIDRLGWRGRTEFLKGSGRKGEHSCDKCGGTGYRGRIGIFEVLTISRRLREMICEGATPDQLRAVAIQDGFRSLWMSGLERVLQGETTLEQLLYYTGRPDAEAEGLPEIVSEADISTQRLHTE
ncbi:MAG: ATPase, T2SS/T4P/T4SS family [Candidatus Bathyarchaeia archaeon]